MNALGIVGKHLLGAVHRFDWVLVECHLGLGELGLRGQGDLRALQCAHGLGALHLGSAKVFAAIQEVRFDGQRLAEHLNGIVEIVAFKRGDGFLVVAACGRIGIVGSFLRHQWLRGLDAARYITSYDAVNCIPVQYW